MVWTMVGLWAGPTAAQKVVLPADRWADQRVHPMVSPKVGQRAEMSVDSTVLKRVWTMAAKTAGQTAGQKVVLSADQ